jgi:hypothetical protein
MEGGIVLGHVLENLSQNHEEGLPRAENNPGGDGLGSAQ